MQNTSSFEKNISFLKSGIEKALNNIPLDNTPDYLYNPVQYVIKGKGKRLRPILVHLAGHSYSADPEDLMKTSLAIELLHNFTLVHDDIMDNANFRHGQESVHKKWDVSTAILTGDAIFVLSQLLLTGLPSIITQRFNEVSLNICEGQGMDKQFENDDSIIMGQYLIMIGKKTGALLGLCAELGGLLSGVNKENAHSLFKFGLNLGLAFQIQDDLLDVFGDKSSMGKNPGGDIYKNKKTALTILAKENNSQKWSEFTRKHSKLSEYQSYFEKNNLKVEVEKVVKHYINKANTALASAPEADKQYLQNFTSMVLKRKF
ncbi:MAG: polyprenyl synthetase family protein [Candidatus Marinimicrobia bacterium]|nr:polyprenyl synthetase family protein [Candidatus Neomarinimicrobiota bacterium]